MPSVTESSILVFNPNVQQPNIHLNPKDPILNLLTRVICIGLASNVTGRTHLEALKKIVEMTSTMKKKPYIFLDATHFIPHQCCDLTSFGADAVICSSYKYFGPHLGVMAYNKQRFSVLTPTKVGVRFDAEGRIIDDHLYPGDVPSPDNCHISRWENGTPNYEGKDLNEIFWNGKVVL